MSGLGYVSTLEPYAASDPSLILRADFEGGEVPELPAGWFTRAGKTTRITQDGRIEVVDVDQPALTWLGDGYGLSVEPAATNALTVANNPSSPLRVLGFDAAFGVTVTPVDAPDGSMTALRMTGEKTGRPIAGHVIATADGAGCALTLVVRAAPGSSGLFRTQFRNARTGISANQMIFNLQTGQFLQIGPNETWAAQRLINGWWMLQGVRIDASTQAGDTLQVYIPADANGPVVPTDFWYATMTNQSMSTSLIIPGTTAQARAAPTVSIPMAGIWDANVGGVLYGDVDIGDYGHSSLWPYIGMQVDGNNRMGLYLPPYGNSGDVCGAASVVAGVQISNNYVTGKRRARFACQQMPNTVQSSSLSGNVVSNTTPIGQVAPAYQTLHVSHLNAVCVYIRDLRIYNRVIDLTRATLL